MTFISGRLVQICTPFRATVRIPDMHMEESEKILARIKEVLAHDFQITHTTIQFERAGLPVHAGLLHTRRNRAVQAIKRRRIGSGS